MIALHCDADGCDTWATRDMAERAGFLTVTNGPDAIADLCGWDCLLRYAAAHEPTTTIGGQL